MAEMTQHHKRVDENLADIAAKNDAIVCANNDIAYKNATHAENVKQLEAERAQLESEKKSVAAQHKDNQTAVAARESAVQARETKVAVGEAALVAQKKLNDKMKALLAE